MSQCTRDLQDWLPPRDLIEAACLAHDLGHPPFGHKGEQELHRAMLSFGGFEGNGQTLRILTKLEKYKERGKGLYPTRRLMISVLKYPCSMNDFDMENYYKKPPKCYHNEEREVVEWALSGFSDHDQTEFQEKKSGRPQYHSFDCSILELADDIAYAVHDIEDILSRGLAPIEKFRCEVKSAFKNVGGSIAYGDIKFDGENVSNDLLGNSFDRKQMISKLVNFFITSVDVRKNEKLNHPLLRYKAVLPEQHKNLLSAFKQIPVKLVIKEAKVQQLERRGQMIISQLFDSLVSAPEELIPESSWLDGCIECFIHRRVCDYIAGMTDSYAEKLYKRLFQPGFGSSGDEL